MSSGRIASKITAISYLTVLQNLERMVQENQSRKAFVSKIGKMRSQNENFRTIFAYNMIIFNECIQGKIIQCVSSARSDVFKKNIDQLAAVRESIVR